MNRLSLQELDQHLKQTPYGYFWGKEEARNEWSLEWMCVVDMGIAFPKTLASDPWENGKAKPLVWLCVDTDNVSRRRPLQRSPPGCLGAQNYNPTENALPKLTKPVSWSNYITLTPAALFTYNDLNSLTLACALTPALCSILRNKHDECGFRSREPTLSTQPQLSVHLSFSLFSHHLELDWVPRGQVKTRKLFNLKIC